MIDRTMRKHLADSIESLVLGVINTDDFMATIEKSRRSCDLGVAEICRFSMGLFHDIYPYRLHRTKIDDSTMSLVQRSVLFLRSDCEYEWTRFPDFKYSNYIFISGFILLISSLIATWASHSIIIFLALLTTGAILLVSVVTYQSIRQKQIISRYWSHVDQALWPFIRQDDYMAASQQNLSV